MTTVLTLTDSLNGFAEKYATSFLDGNRNYVIKEIGNFPQKEAIALSAMVVLKLAPILQQDFVHLAIYFSE